MRETTQDTGPEIGPGDDAEQAAFREHCRSWLAANVPPAPPFPLPRGPLEIAEREQLDYLVAWQRAAHGAGLVGCDYPEAFGGGGRTDCQRIANEEMCRVRAPFLPNIVGLGMAGPAILVHGTDEQRRRLLPPLLSGEDVWCQGFSEPDAGSDLANVQTFARREGDHWIVSGHKVWTTLAHFARWMILLCRTDRDSKYGGLSYFVVPIEENVGRGVTIRPLVKMTGELGFNEVLFEDLVVPDDLRLDEVGKGWAVAMTTLAHERGAGGLVTPRSGAEVGDESGEALTAAGLVELARRCGRYGTPAAADPALRDAIVRAMIREKAYHQTRRRAGVATLTDDPQRLPLQHKLVHSEILQETARLACTIEGLQSTLYLGDENAPAEGQWPLAYLGSYGYTIAAGSNEIQRNILGERVLGLPKSR